MTDNSLPVANISDIIKGKDSNPFYIKLEFRHIPNTSIMQITDS